MHSFLKLNEVIEKYPFCFLCICRCLPEYIYLVYIFRCADICAYIYIYIWVYIAYIHIWMWIYFDMGVYHCGCISKVDVTSRCRDIKM